MISHTRQIRVLVADDHPVMITGIQATLSAAPLIEIVGKARSFDEALRLLKEVAVDVVVADLRGMGGSPLTFAQRLRLHYPAINIVIFSSSMDFAVDLLQAGVRGYVIKEDDALIAAIETVQAGDRFLSPSVAEYIDRTMVLRREHHLAPKEQQLLALLAEGLQTDRIAEQMEVDPRVVYNYLSSIRRKTGLKGRPQIIDWYRRMYLDGENQRG